MSILALVIISLIKIVIVIVALLTAFAYLTYIERKVQARIQVRIGPDRAGPWGLLQPIADAIKMIMKEDIIPSQADKPLFIVAPALAVIMALLAFAAIPIGPAIEVLGYRIEMAIANVNVGLLYTLGILSLNVYGIVLGGWSSGNKYSFLGGMRSSAQMISYELAMGMSIIGVVLLSSSLNLTDFVDAQKPVWFAWLQPVGFLIYIVCMFADTNRLPFDLPEAETELVAGYHTEYSSIKYALFYMAEYINMVTVSCLGVGHRVVPGRGAVPGRLARPGGVGRVVVRRQSGRLHLAVHVGARHAAALPLRPAHEVWLAGAAAAIHSQCVVDRLRRGRLATLEDETA